MKIVLFEFYLSICKGVYDFTALFHSVQFYALIKLHKIHLPAGGKQNLPIPVFPVRTMSQLFKNSKKSTIFQKFSENLTKIGKIIYSKC